MGKVGSIGEFLRARKADVYVLMGMNQQGGNATMQETVTTAEQAGGHGGQRPSGQEPGQLLPAVAGLAWGRGGGPGAGWRRSVLDMASISLVK